MRFIISKIKINKRKIYSKNIFDKEFGMLKNHNSEKHSNFCVIVIYIYTNNPSTRQHICDITQL